jgi:Family of unknown function (DUF6879)
MTPLDLYQNCRVSAYRLEVQQYYHVPEDIERQAAFREGRPLPPPRPHAVESLRLIRQLTQAGRRIGRVHVVDRPLSEYVRYELSLYPSNVEAGEEVWIADRSAHPDLDQLRTDFAIIDGETGQPDVITFQYDDAGRLLGYEHVADRDLARRCWQDFVLVRECAVPLAEFVATGRRRP